MASSSIVTVEPWLMMYAVPTAAAARAAATSPRGHSMPDNPVGPMITGDASRSPNSTID